MPLPKPEKNQKRTDFVNSCMDNSAMLKEFPDSEQRAAVCYSRFDKKAKASITGDLSGEIVIDLTPLIKAKEMARKSINDLPDSDFAYIQPGGKKEDGKTNVTKLSLKSLFKAKALKKIKSAAKKFGIKMAESGSSHRSEPLEEHFKDMRDRLHYKMDEQDSYDAKHETLREWREHHQGAIKNIDNEIASLKKDKGEDKQDVKDES